MQLAIIITQKVTCDITSFSF